MNAELRTARADELTVQRDVQRYPLEPGLWITLTDEAAHWRCAVESSAPAGGEPVLGADALTHLLRYHQVPPVERFQLVRHVPAPEASGERPVDDDAQVVVVGERVVVSWNRRIRDIPYTAPITLAQLAAVNFLGVPDTHGLLVWTTPSGHEAPVAVVTRYLPRAVDGRNALNALLTRGPAVEPGESPSLAGRIGRIAAALHVALATRSSVLAEPIRQAAPADLHQWHRRVHSLLDRAALVAAEGTAPDRARGYRASLSRLEADADALDRVARADDEVVLQRVHGDLHVGRILRWAGGLTITGFGDEPDCDPAVLAPQPAARDVARLLHSLTSVARLADEDAGEHPGDGRCSTEWLPDARRRVLEAYRTELSVANRPDLLDERLIPAFEAEHAAREVIAAAHGATLGDSFERLSLPPA
jgi:predicted trehalose synthase